MIYENEYLRQISFPLGGIGTGSVGLGGNGILFEPEIKNRPAKGTFFGYTHFAVKAKLKNGKIITKVLFSDCDTEYIGRYAGNAQYSGFGYGISYPLSGMPHFRKCVFDGEFPIARLTFSDDNFPADVHMTAFNPFIPNDADNSSIPAAFFKIEFDNKTNEEIEFTAALSVQGIMNDDLCVNTVFENDFSKGVSIRSTLDSEDTAYGDITVAGDKNSVCQPYWFVGRWSDALTIFWKEFSSDCELRNRVYDEPIKSSCCTVATPVTVSPNSISGTKFVLSWNFPNNYNYWSPLKDSDGKDVIWKNYYATKFIDSVASAKYSFKNFDEFYNKTKLFKDTLFASTVDDCIKDAVSSTLSVLKSPTVFRLTDGSFYGFEGVHEKEGSCEGTCQHVWNYAYALCFLFPELERSIRDLEFKYSTNEHGKMVFRLKLPLGRPDENEFRACLDGQMGTVIKFYRDWKLCGDDKILKDNFETIKSIISYAWSEENPDGWDRDRDGVLEGRQHHTLDMELFGPCSWLEGFYLAALKCGAEMAEYLGDTSLSEEYTELFDKGYKFTKDKLFNGKYFIHLIDLKNKSITEKYNSPEYWNDEAEEIKYQIGDGSEIDQLCAQWHADICGIGDIFDPEQVDTTLKNMFKNNFTTSVRDIPNVYRRFSVNDEGGSVICVYPEGTYEPAVPIPYVTETMHGFEYQFAGLLISRGYINEGLAVIKAVRDKYDGKKRNPWNEIECGSNYARSMASFALLPIISGFTFNLQNNEIGFNPIINKENFSCLWSVDGAWGDFKLNKERASVTLKDGELTLSSLVLPFAKKVNSVLIDGVGCDFKFSDGKLEFNTISFKNCIEVIYD